MKQHCVIFMGVQGSGKGTQVKHFEQYLQLKSERAVFRYETGNGFRQLAENTNLTGKKVREDLTEGKLQPLFLTVNLWARAFIAGYNGNQDVLIDGFPRTVAEAEVLHTALEYYELLPADVIVLDLSDETAITRMKERGRDDDTDEAIKKRIEWYKSTVAPIIDWCESRDGYQVHHINGEQEIEAVQASIRAALGIED